MLLASLLFFLLFFTAFGYIFILLLFNIFTFYAHLHFFTFLPHFCHLFRTILKFKCDIYLMLLYNLAYLPTWHTLIKPYWCSLQFSLPFPLTFPICGVTQSLSCNLSIHLKSINNIDFYSVKLNLLCKTMIIIIQ